MPTIEIPSAMNISFHRRKPFIYSLLVLLLAVGLTACDDNPVDDDGDDEHASVEGLAVRLNGIVVYQVLEGAVTCASAPCGITVTEGEETALIRVEFLDRDGDEIHAEDLDEDFSLGYEIEDESIAQFEQHEDDGKWNFHILGAQEGETNMQLQLLHVGHADFTTPPLGSANAITITVTQ